MWHQRPYITYWEGRTQDGFRFDLELTLRPIGSSGTKLPESFWTHLVDSLRVSASIMEQDGDLGSLLRVHPEELDNLSRS